MIGGREERAAAEFDDRSPIDTRILLGTFQQGDARPRARRHRGGQGGVPGVERADPGGIASPC